MRNFARFRDESSTRWHALIAELGPLEDDMVRAYMTEIHFGERYYDHMVEPSDLENAARQAFRYLTRQVTGTPLDDELLEFPAQVGGRRAQQGVPIENLITAVRIDYSVLWSHLIWLARSSDMPILAAHADQLWQAVDEFTTRIHVGYTDARIAMARKDFSDQHAFLRKLLDSPTLGERALSEIASALSLPVDGEYWVAASDDPAQFEVLGGAVSNHYLVDRDAHTIALWRRTAQDPEEALGTAICALAPVAAGLAQVRDRVGVAVALLADRDARTTGPVTLRRGLLPMAHARISATLPTFCSDVLGQLLECTDTERDTLVETALSFARTGDATMSAADLFCHRNTVLNRLRRFRELTDLDLSVPEQSALALVALAGQLP